MTSSHDTFIVIGGGPAGLMAAGTAARDGRDVVLLEKMRTCGRKLRITGKGRCNVTNTAPVREFVRHFGRKGRFLKYALHRFGPDDLTAFLESIGIATAVDRGGRVFPAETGAPGVTDALIGWARSTGVRFRTDATVTGIAVRDGAVQGVTLEDGGSLAGGTVIVATGGMSYPVTGSTGDGYAFAASAGHTVVEPRPALVPLTVADGVPAVLDGLTLRNVLAVLSVDGDRRRSEFGELMFRDGALDGPVVVTMSLDAVDALRSGAGTVLSLDIKPALDHGKLDARLLRDIGRMPGGTVGDLLRGLLPGVLVPVFAGMLDAGLDCPLNQFTAGERKRLRLLLKDWQFTLSGHRGFDRAIVTAGGVALDEVDPETMTSRIVTGLRFAGEVLDLQADTGGYNLQAAFSTGRLAGTAVF